MFPAQQSASFAGNADNADNADFEFAQPALSTRTVQSVRVDAIAVREMLRTDPEFFIEFFIGDLIDRAVPALHIEVFSAMINPAESRLAFAIPRGCAKTTLAKLACAWHILFSPWRFVLYVSGSEHLVVPYVNDIAELFEKENYIAVFGETEWIKRQDGIGIYKFRIPSIDKLCILRGLGAGQRVRGINVDNERPQIAVVDDFETDEDASNSNSSLAFKARLKWWSGPFYKCLNQFSNKIIFLGNYTRKQSILDRVLKSQRWTSFHYGILREDGTSLWPDLWPLDRIREDFLEYQELGRTEQWLAEMQNTPVPEGGAIIKAEEICYRPGRQPGEGAYGCITVDPAISRHDWADNAAIAAHVYIEDEAIWQTVETRYWRGVDPITLFWQIIDLATEWRIRVIGIESVAMQAALAPIYNYLLLQNNLFQYRFVPLSTGNQRKSQRIIAYAAMLKQTAMTQPTWALTQGDMVITQQLLVYEPLRKDNDDDIIDCCAYGPRMIETYLHEIMQTVPGIPQGGFTPLADFAAC